NRLILFSFAALTVSVAPAVAGNVPEPGAAAPIQVSEGDIADVVIDEIERRLIASYYQRHYDEWEHEHGKGKKKGNKSLPPGLAKRDELPPGLAKQLARNGHLPPGLERRNLPP